MFKSRLLLAAFLCTSFLFASVANAALVITFAFVGAETNNGTSFSNSGVDPNLIATGTAATADFTEDASVDSVQTFPGIPEGQVIMDLSVDQLANTDILQAEGDWILTFQSTVPGVFSIDYDVILNGVAGSRGFGVSVGTGFSNLTTTGTGTLSTAVAANVSETVTIGGLVNQITAGPADSQITGTFDWKFTESASAVPEPSSVVVLAFGVVGLVTRRKRKSVTE